MKKVLVTGANGFIASHIVKQLLEKGYIVHGTVRDPSNEKKVAHLKKLKHADTKLKLFKADLLQKGSFDESIKGCEGVFHTASPFFHKTSDPENDLLKPATDGTKNVLESCEKEGVKAVIVTSSCAAVFCGVTVADDHKWTEDDWSDIEVMKKKKMWYPLSKTLAEKEVWNWAEKVKGKIRVAVINPTLVIGPTLQPTLNESTEMILSWVNGTKKEVPNRPSSFVDVRDVATAHILAYENSEATGRHLAASSSYHWKDTTDLMRKLFPQYKDTIPSNFKLKEGEKYKPAKPYSNEKLEKLGIQFTTFEKTLKDTIISAKQNGFL